MHIVFETSIPDLPLVARGKVRDVYAVGDDQLLLVATDRISAFDCILGSPIPGKGVVLILMIQRAKMPGGDASEIRRVFQETALGR